MGKNKANEIIEKHHRNKKFSNFIRERTLKSKIKYVLLEEYEKGNFFSIPPELFSRENPGDRRFLGLLERIYLNSNVDYQAIPEGLFDLTDHSEINLLFSNLAKKMKMGVIIDYSFIPESDFNPIELETLEKLKMFNERTIAQKEDYVIDSFIDKDGFTDVEMVERYDTSPPYSHSYLYKNRYLKRDVIINSADMRKSIKSFGIENDKKNLFGEDFSGEITVAEINAKIREKMKSQSEIDGSYIGKVYEQLFMRSYAKVFKQIELEATYMSNDELNEILKQQFYKFSVEDGILNGTQTERQQNSLKMQKNFIQAVLVSLARTGCLDELLMVESENLKQLNELLSKDCQLEYFDEISPFDDLYGINYTTQEGIVDLYTFGRHYTNKLAHNYIDYAYSILEMNSINDSDYNQLRADEFDNYLEAVYQVIGDGTNVDKNELDRILFVMMPGKREREQSIETVSNVLKNINNPEAALKKARSIIKLRLESNDCFEKNRRCKYDSITEYFYNVINELKDMQKQYYNTIREQTGNKRVDPQSFEDIFKQILDGTIKKENFTDFKREELKKKGKVRSVYLVDKVQELVSKIKEDGFTEEPEEVLMKIVGTLEKVEELFSAKQFFTEAIIEIAEKRPDLIRLEHKREVDEETNTGGVFDVILPGKIQVFGGHYKEGEFDQTDTRIKALPSVNDKLSDCFSTDDKKAGSLNVFIPYMKKLHQGQIDEFKKLLITINHLDGNLTVSEGQIAELQGYEKLKDLKTSSPESYESMKIRIALGAGIEEYKKRYGVECLQERATSKTENTTHILNTFQKGIANLIIEEVNSGRALQDVIAELGNVHEGILEYVRTKTKQLAFYQNPTDEINRELENVERDTREAASLTDDKSDVKKQPEEQGE